MGIDIGSKLLVGLYYDDFPDWISEEQDDFVEWAESQGLSYASPWYDASPRDYFYGFEVLTRTLAEVIDELQLQEKNFIALTNCKPIVYAGANVY